MGDRSDEERKAFTARAAGKHAVLLIEGALFRRGFLVRSYQLDVPPDGFRVGWWISLPVGTSDEAVAVVSSIYGVGKQLQDRPVGTHAWEFLEATLVLTEKRLEIIVR